MSADSYGRAAHRGCDSGLSTGFGRCFYRQAERGAAESRRAAMCAVSCQDHIIQKEYTSVVKTSALVMTCCVTVHFQASLFAK